MRFIALGEPEYPPALRADRFARRRSSPFAAARRRCSSRRSPSSARATPPPPASTFADRLARGLGQAGYVVVSGLARGVDQRAHVAALATGTVGVLAGGHAKPYPPEAAPLIAPRIAEHRRGRLGDADRMGAARARFPTPQPHRLGLVARRRWSSRPRAARARSSPRDSRSIRTARCSPFPARRSIPRAEGTNDLLRDGARLCARVDDVLNVLDPVRAQDPFAMFREDSADASEPLWGELPLLGVDPEAAPRAKPAQAFDEAHAGAFGLDEDDAIAEVERLLGPSPITLDELAQVSGLPLRQVRVAVMELDLAGRIEHSGGERVALLVGETAAERFSLLSGTRHRASAPTSARPAC